MIPRSWAKPSSGLKPRDLHVAIMLFSYGSDAQRPAFPSIDTIAAKTGLSRSTVKRSLRKMIALGHIIAERVPGSTTRYRVAKFARTQVIQSGPGVGQIRDPRVDHLVDHKSKAEEKSQRRADGLQALAQIKAKHPFLRRA